MSLVLNNNLIALLPLASRGSRHEATRISRWVAGRRYRVGTGATGDEQVPISHEKLCLLPCRHYCSSVAGEVIE
jgi:hypothetical protein